MKTLNFIVYLWAAFALFIIIQNGCKETPHSPITRIEITKWKDRLVIQKDSSAENLKIVYRDRIKTERIETYLKGDSWPFYVKDSTFCDSSIRHLLGAVKHLEKQHEMDSAVQVTFEQIVSTQDSVINQQDKQIAKGEKQVKRVRKINRFLFGIAAIFGYFSVRK